MFLRRLFLCLSLIVLVACNSEKEEHASHSEHSKMSGHDMHKQAAAAETIIKKAGPLQLSFDITPLDQHLEMMKSMNMEVEHKTNTSHYITLTLLDKNKKIVRDAPVKIKIVAPDKTVLTDSTGNAMETMSQGNMFHYGYGFNPEAKGNYEVIVMFEYAGEVYTSGTPWKHN